MRFVTKMPNDMYTYEYSHFLQGVKDACTAWGGNLLGGNIKDGKEFSVTLPEQQLVGKSIKIS